jgi:hypothetical protein
VLAGMLFVSYLHSTSEFIHLLTDKMNEEVNVGDLDLTGFREKCLMEHNRLRAAGVQH